MTSHADLPQPDEQERDITFEMRFRPSLMREMEDLTEEDFARLGRKVYRRAWRLKNGESS